MRIDYFKEPLESEDDDDEDDEAYDEAEEEAMEWDAAAAIAADVDDDAAAAGGGGGDGAARPAGGGSRLDPAALGGRTVPELKEMLREASRNDGVSRQDRVSHPLTSNRPPRDALVPGARPQARR